MSEFNYDLDQDLEELMSHLTRDDENTLELEVRAKKKESTPATFEQLIHEKIHKYNRDHIRLPDFLRAIDTDDDDNQDPELAECIGKVVFVCDEYMNVSSANGDLIILLPDGNKDQFSAGTEGYFLTEQYDGYAFLVLGLSADEHVKMSDVLSDLSVKDKVTQIKKAKVDPEGVALWSSLGSIKREDTKRSIEYKRLIEERAEEVLKRIPSDRNDLYAPLERILSRFSHCCSSEKADYAETLSSMERLMVMMLCEPQNTSPRLTIDDINRLFPGASIKETALAGKRRGEVPPNILIVGRDCDNAIAAIRENGCNVRTIDMAGVEGNDYLFGDRMSYYCSGIGRLVREYEEAGTLSAVMVLESVDLMGTSVRSSNPLYGVAKLLRKHHVQDFHLPDFEIDVSQTQFICQVNDLESCPPLLLGEMDIIIEL